MNRHAIVPAVLLALASPGLATATPGSAPSSVSALALADPLIASHADALRDDAPASTAITVSTVDGQVAGYYGTTNRTTFESVSYRPRRHRHRYPEEYSEPKSSHSSGYAQLHGGFFDPEAEQASNATVFGFRAGGSLDRNFQIGLGVDWHHRSAERSTVVREVPVPGGTAEQRLELGHQSSNLFPTMAFLQISPGGGALIPYFGIGGGYEVLFLSAEDFETGAQFDATYGGWGWQAWAGLAIPVASQTRLAAEVYTNTADVSRDVDDPTTGHTVKEIIGVNGVGARFGLSWGF
jgi:hypothetical protein